MSDEEIRELAASATGIGNVYEQAVVKALTKIAKELVGIKQLIHGKKKKKKMHRK